MTTNNDDHDLVSKPSDSRAGTTTSAAIPLKKRLAARNKSGVKNREVPNPNAAGDTAKDDLVPKPCDSRAGTSGGVAAAAIPLKKRLAAKNESGVKNHEVPIPNAAGDTAKDDLVPKPSDSRAGTTTSGGVAAAAIPLKKRLATRNESGVKIHQVPNPNASVDPLATTTNDYQLNVRRSALYLCAEAFRGEASTMLEVRTEAIRVLMNWWNIPHVSLEPNNLVVSSPPHAPVPTNNQQQSVDKEAQSVVSTRTSDSNNIPSEDNFQADLVPPKPQSDGDDKVTTTSDSNNIPSKNKSQAEKPQSVDTQSVVARRTSGSNNIPSEGNFQADLVPPKPQSDGDDKVTTTSDSNNIPSKNKSQAEKPQSVDTQSVVARRTSGSNNIPSEGNFQADLVPPKPQSDGDDKVATRTSGSNNIPSEDNFQTDLVLPPKPQSDGDDKVATRTSGSNNIPSEDNFQTDLVLPPKPQSDGDDKVATRTSGSNIPSKDKFQADLILPPTQQRSRKTVERYSDIEQLPFSCVWCGQKFSAQSNLTTHKKKCKKEEEVDEEEGLAWSQKKRRGCGH